MRLCIAQSHATTYDASKLIGLIDKCLVSMRELLEKEMPGADYEEKIQYSTSPLPHGGTQYSALITWEQLVTK